MFGGNEKEVKYTGSKSDQLNGLLDKGCTFEGKLTFDGTVQINGDFQGEIYSDGTLVVGNDARVSAKIFVDTIITYGKVEGEIEAKNKVEMHVPAVVVAKVNTKSLSVEDGVIFEGQCHMERSAVDRVDIESPVEDDESEEESEESEDSEENDEDVLVM